MSALLTDIQCDDTFINYSDMKDMAKEAKIPIAPEYCIGPFHENLATELAEETSLFEDGISATLGKGIMIRPLRERLSDAGRVAFSVSNPAFKPAERLFCD
jgi:hypothetical protein